MPARRSNRCPCPETEASLRLVCVYLLRSIVWRTIGTEGHVHIGGFLLFGPCFLFQESRKVWSPDTVNESDSSCRVVRGFPSCRYLSSCVLTDMNSAINLCVAASSSVIRPLYMRSTASEDKRRNSADCLSATALMEPQSRIHSRCGRRDWDALKGADA